MSIPKLGRNKLAGTEPNNLSDLAIWWHPYPIAKFEHCEHLSFSCSLPDCTVWYARYRWRQHRATMRTCPAKTTHCWWRLGNVSAH
jgi:hypothetical protein